MYRGMKMAIVCRAVLCVALLSGLAAVHSAHDSGRALAADFLAGFQDLPLMPGLQAVDEAGLVFDSPSGRIAEAYVTGSVQRRKVTDFYRETLPALGWQPRSENRYEREGEELTIDFFEGEAGLTVRFTSAPAQVN